MSERGRGRREEGREGGREGGREWGGERTHSEGDGAGEEAET